MKKHLILTKSEAKHLVNAVQRKSTTRAYARFITIRNYDNIQTVSFARVVKGKHRECKTELHMRTFSKLQFQRLDDLSFKADKVTCIFFKFGTMVTMGFFNKDVPL